MKNSLFLALFLLKTASSLAQNTCFDAYLYEANIRAICERGTSVWVGTDLGLVEIDRATKAIKNRYDRNNSPIDGPVTALTAASDGTLCVGTSNFWRTKNFQFWQKELEAGSAIRDIHVQGDSLVWVCTAEGLWQLGKVVGGKLFNKGNSALGNNWCNRARSDQFGNVWVGVGQAFSQGGLVKIPPTGTWTFYKKPGAPLPQTSAVRDLLIDKEGSVWLAAEDLVLKFDTTKSWTSFEPEPGFGGDYNVCSIAQKPTGEIVVGMENSVFEMNGPADWTGHEMPGFFTDNVFIFNLLAASDGSVWAGSNVNGLGVLEGGVTKRVLTSGGGLPLAPVSSMGIAPDGKLWAGTAFGGLTWLENGAWKLIDSLLKEQPSVQVLDIQFDTDGQPLVLMNLLWNKWTMLKFDGAKFTELTSGISGFSGKRKLRRSGDAWYVCSTRGLFRWEDNALTLIDTSNSAIPTVQLLDMDVDPDGNLWMATARHGLLFFDGNGFVSYDSATQGLPTDSLIAITIGADGYPFFSDAKGRLLHFSPAGLEMWKDTTAVADNRIALLDAAPNGGIWLNNQTGVTRFDPNGPPGAQWLAFPGDEAPFVVADGQARTLLAADGFTYVGKNTGIYKIDESCYAPLATAAPPGLFSEIRAVPNPAGEATVIEFFLKKQSDAALELLDLTGRRVFFKKLGSCPAGANRAEIGLGGLTPGAYFFKITGGNGVSAAGRLVRT